MKKVSVRFGLLGLPLVSLLWGVLGCGGGITESHFIYAVEKPKNCELALLQLSQKELATGSPYEILGQVTLPDGDPNNPFQKAYRDDVRPRACAMGGEGVAVPRTDEKMDRRGAKLVYTVVRKPQPITTPPPKF